MNKRLLMIAVAAVLLSFAGGFLLANSLNRKDLEALRAENENLKKAQTETAQSTEEGSLSDEEIREKIAEADRNPSNIPFQKNLGLALYNYAAMKQNADLLREVSRLITRVYENNPNDYEAIVALGNIHFDLGFFNNSNEDFVRARDFYTKALAKKPEDADVLTDAGLTHLLSEPPENAAAIEQFQKSLRINPKGEKTLQGIIQALRGVNKTDEAEKYAARLKEINPKNEILNALPETDDKTSAQNQ